MNPKEIVTRLRRQDVNTHSPELLLRAEKIWDESMTQAKLRIVTVQGAYKKSGMTLSDRDYQNINCNLTYFIADKTIMTEKKMGDKRNELRARITEIETNALAVLNINDPLFRVISQDAAAEYGRQVVHIASEIMNYTQGLETMTGREQKFAAATALSVNMINQIRSRSIAIAK